MVDVSVIKFFQFFFTLPAGTKEIITWNKELNHVQNLCAKQPFLNHLQNLCAKQPF